MKILAFLLLSLYIFGVSTEEKKSTTMKTTTRDPMFTLLETCYRFCSIYLTPVCANNGICTYEFHNMCRMRNKNCYFSRRNRPEFQLINKGQCWDKINRCTDDQLK
ncbi:uncharacterized protein [Drosophila kikkawai]|uniref:Kazal-like domain-containing protein n=1 Tax=Drosophila kikkawai TaxID=30033 RepID=A0A6P4HZ24_DROKI|nr:uncharacterized protein LOC108074244 [Drosophila kikkawai]